MVREGGEAGIRKRLSIIWVPCTINGDGVDVNYKKVEWFHGDAVVCVDVNYAAQGAGHNLGLIHEFDYGVDQKIIDAVVRKGPLVGSRASADNDGRSAAGPHPRLLLLLRRRRFARAASR